MTKKALLLKSNQTLQQEPSPRKDPHSHLSLNGIIGTLSALGLFTTLLRCTASVENEDKES